MRRFDSTFPLEGQFMAKFNKGRPYHGSADVARSAARLDCRDRLLLFLLPAMPRRAHPSNPGLWRPRGRDRAPVQESGDETGRTCPESAAIIQSASKSSLTLIVLPL